MQIAPRMPTPEAVRWSRCWAESFFHNIDADFKVKAVGYKHLLKAIRDIAQDMPLRLYYLFLPHHEMLISVTRTLLFNRQPRLSDPRPHLFQRRVIMVYRLVRQLPGYHRHP